MDPGTPLPNVNDWATLLASLEESAAEIDGDAWPTAGWNLFADFGVFDWVIPQEFGGQDVSGAELTFGYARLSQADLLSTFVLTQRNGACQRIASSPNESLKASVLPRCLTGELFPTVGISHLTTSRQHVGKPAVQANETENGFVLNGMIPWVTAADKADHILTGATLSDGRQLLILVPTAAPGVECLPSATLLALTGSRTGPVQLSDVEVSSEWLVAGPIEQVMKQPVGGGGAGSVTTSALAVGVAKAAVEGLQREAEHRDELREVTDPLNSECVQLVNHLAAATGPECDGTPDAKSIRQRANSLALRSTQAFLAASKGAGFVRGHLAERLVRQAMFFLVWSCPQPVVEANLREFACLIHG